MLALFYFKNSEPFPQKPCSKITQNSRFPISETARFCVILRFRKAGRLPKPKHLNAMVLALKSRSSISNS